ncbi:hypothetical protein ARMGADRAFT_1034049 [Armillaria gallica]|uniref:Uncharacterized protein n=1 Tax=Armillaria gallica TaxID=47427 RepID=A0A2H3DAC8_ARMGA|nr:hypothetical protein ARMGADRAFT_1034049 [Armillaria gallica]
MPRCTRITLFLAPRSNLQPEVPLEPLNEPELVNLNSQQDLSSIWYTPPGPPCSLDADVDPPQLTQTEIRRVRYRVRGRPREESEMLEEELSDLLACANITGPEYELGNPSLAGPSTGNSGPAHLPRNPLNNLTTVSVEPSREDSSRKLSASGGTRRGD